MSWVTPVADSHSPTITRWTEFAGLSLNAYGLVLFTREVTQVGLTQSGEPLKGSGPFLKREPERRGGFFGLEGVASMSQGVCGRV